MTTRSRRFARQLFILVLIAALSACASVSLAPAAADLRAKEFRPEPQKANIYIARRVNVSLGLLFGVVADDQYLGELANETYFLVEADPGEHTLRVVGGEGAKPVTFHAEAGKNYYFRMTLGMGAMTTRVGIKQVDEEKGKALVSKCKMAG